MLDTYNQQIQEDVSCTIRTNINTANHHFIVEEAKIIKEGNYSPSGHNASSIVSTQGIAPAVMENHGTVTAIKEPQVINPLKDHSDNGWHFEQQVYDAECIARAVKAGECSGNIPKEIEVGRVKDGRHQQDFVQHEEGICRCICTGTHASTPHLLKTMVSEPISVAMRGRNPNNPSERGKSNGNYKQRLEMNESVVTNYRIRKLTPRECFRLMGVDDADINKIQASGISNSQQYKCAGNSIVVDVLYHIFRKMFCETHSENIQQTLF